MAPTSCTCCGRRPTTIDWPRLVARFDDYWEVLLSHLVLFGFVFPAERHRVPPQVVRLLLDRYQQLRPDDRPAVCRGTLLSREQYLVDVEHRGDHDARLRPFGRLSAEDLEPWTAEIPATRRATLATRKVLPLHRRRADRSRMFRSHTGDQESGQ